MLYVKEGSFPPILGGKRHGRADQQSLAHRTSSPPVNGWCNHGHSNLIGSLMVTPRMVLVRRDVAKINSE